MKTTEPDDRVVPSNTGPGPITEMAKLLPGEKGMDALERIGEKVLPQAGRKRGPKKGTKLPRQLAAILAMRTEGMSNKEIAKAMHMTVSNVSRILGLARQRSFLSDIVDRMENRAVPQAVENLIEGLDEGDREYTLATLKGVGVFRTHGTQKTEQTNQNLNVLRVEFVMPDFTQIAAPQTAIGSIASNPHRTLPAADVVDGETV